MAQKFIWHDLMTSDTKAAESFYKTIVGWNMADSGQPGGGYTVLMAGQSPVGGIMAIPGDSKDMPPCWTGYIGVDDVDVWTKKVIEKGGKVWKGPQDIPGVGRVSRWLPIRTVQPSSCSGAIPTCRGWMCRWIRPAHLAGTN